MIAIRKYNNNVFLAIRLLLDDSVIYIYIYALFTLLMAKFKSLWIIVEFSSSLD